MGHFLSRQKKETSEEENMWNAFQSVKEQIVHDITARLYLLVNSSDQKFTQSSQALVQEIRDKNCKIDGMALLISAIRMRRSDLVELCLKEKALFGIDLNQKNAKEQGRTALHIAAEVDSMAVEALVAAGADFNAVDNNQQTALHIAAQHANYSAIDVLVKFKINVNAVDANQQTALHIAVDFSYQQFQQPSCVVAFMVKSLVEAGINVNAADKDQETALHYAFKWQNSEVVDLLLNANADLGLCNKAGHTPYQGFTNGKDILGTKQEFTGDDIGRVLNARYKVLEHCTGFLSLFTHSYSFKRVPLETDELSTPINAIFKKLFRDTRLEDAPEEQLRQVKALKAKLEKTDIWNDLSLTAKLYYRISLLVRFSSQGRVLLLENLLNEPSCFKSCRSFQAYPSHSSDKTMGIVPAYLHGTTVLTAALLEEWVTDEHRVQTIHFLIKSGFDVNQVDSMGRTPLMVAIELQRVEAVKALLEHKPRLQLADGKKNVLQWLKNNEIAKKDVNKNIEISKMLEYHLRQRMSELPVGGKAYQALTFMLYSYDMMKQEEFDHCLEEVGNIDVKIETEEDEKCEANKSEAKYSPQPSAKRVVLFSEESKKVPPMFVTPNIVPKKEEEQTKAPLKPKASFSGEICHG